MTPTQSTKPESLAKELTCLFMRYFDVTPNGIWADKVERAVEDFLKKNWAADVPFAQWQLKCSAHDSLVKENAELKAQLDVAMKALNKYKQIVWRETMEGPIWAAQDALDDIKKLKDSND